MLTLIVGSEAFEIADGDSGLMHLHVDTLALTLLLLRADTATDSGQRRGLTQHGGSAEDIATLNILDKVGNLDMHGTAFDTRGLGAVEAAVRLLHGHLLRQAFVHLFRARGSPVVGIELGHLHAWDRHALFWLHRLTEVGTPGSGAVGEGSVAFVSSGDSGFMIGNGLARCFRGGTGIGCSFVDPVLHLLALDTFEGVHATRHLVPVDLVSVKLGTVDTDEARLATDRQAAGTAHARAVDHDGVERYVVGDVIFLG